MPMDIIMLLKEKGDDLKLELLTGCFYLGRIIAVPNIHRPCLAFAGFFEHFSYGQI
ncbi:hypothetical protein AGMMS49990_04820 [Endomicrobiia bacterium]|nr:hypothetical protein AGMMS49990_04820 [Endomicrobiia bacterium]